MPGSVADSTASSALQWQLEWTWLLPAWASLLLALSVIAWIAALYAGESAPIGKSRRVGLALLRIAALGIIAMMIAQPTIKRFRQGRPSVVLLVDRSASMATDDVTAGNETLTRLQWSLRQSSRWLQQWQTSHRTVVASFSGNVSRLAEPEALEELNVAEPDKGTELGKAIEFALNRAVPQTPTAVVVLSDGINTKGTSLKKAAAMAQRLRVPLFTVAVGSDHRQPDLRLEDLIAEDIVFPGDFVQVEATLVTRNMEGQRAIVSLRNRATEEELARLEVPIAEELTRQTVRLGCRMTAPGELPLQLSVAADVAEKNTENNSLQHTVKVSDEKIHVLLVDSSPSYEYRSLVSLLSRDPAVSLHTWLQEADPDFAEVDRAALGSLPSNESELLQYDVVVLGDVDPGPLPPSFWSGLQAVVAERGRGLVVIAGPRFMPHAYRDNRALAELLPIDLQRQPTTLPEIDTLATFQLVPTRAGSHLGMMQLADDSNDSQTVWEHLPPITWLSPVERLKPGAQVLAGANDTRQATGGPQPVIVRHYVGAGEVLYQATDETWRWKWRSDDRLFARYWGQAVRRLGRSRVASQREGILLTTDRKEYRPGQSVRLQARFRNSSVAPAEADGVAVELVGETQARREIRLERRLGYRGVFEQKIFSLPPDRYVARVISPVAAGMQGSAAFEVKALPGELARTEVDLHALAQAAELTGGKTYTTATADGLTEDLPPPRTVYVESLDDRPLWNSHWVLAALLAVLTTEWILRRRSAML